MKEYNVDDFDVLIGIDWADKKHDICEHPNKSDDYHYCVITSKPEALHDWAMDLKNAIRTKKLRSPTN